MRSAQRIFRELCPKIPTGNSYSVCRTQGLRLRDLRLNNKKIYCESSKISPLYVSSRDISETFSSKITPVRMTCLSGPFLKSRIKTDIATERYMAGHSHWKNIKHIKEAKDAAKSELNNQQLKIMAQIIKDGGADPKKNSKLAAHMDRVMKMGVPKSTVQRFIEKYEKHADMMETFYIEVRGPAGSLIVAELQSPHQSKSKQEMNSLIKKTSGQIQKQMSWQHLFEQKGVVTVPLTPELALQSMDHFFEVAIETGAEDVILTKNETSEIEAESLLKFHCSPKNIATVAQSIEDLYDMEVISKEIDLSPNVWATIDNDDDIEACQKILERIEGHPDVTNVFDNISVPEE